MAAWASLCWGESARARSPEPTAPWRQGRIRSRAAAEKGALTPLRALERLCDLSAFAREQLRALLPAQRASDLLGGFMSAAQPALREVASRLISEVRSPMILRRRE